MMSIKHNQITRGTIELEANGSNIVEWVTKTEQQLKEEFSRLAKSITKKTYPDFDSEREYTFDKGIMSNSIITDEHYKLQCSANMKSRQDFQRQREAASVLIHGLLPVGVVTTLEQDSNYVDARDDHDFIQMITSIKAHVVGPRGPQMAQEKLRALQQIKQGQMSFEAYASETSKLNRAWEGLRIRDPNGETIEAVARNFVWNLSSQFDIHNAIQNVSSTLNWISR